MSVSGCCCMSITLCLQSLILQHFAQLWTWESGKKSQMALLITKLTNVALAVGFAVCCKAGRPGDTNAAFCSLLILHSQTTSEPCRPDCQKVSLSTRCSATVANALLCSPSLAACFACCLLIPACMRFSRSHMGMQQAVQLLKVQSHGMLSLVNS